MMRGLSSSIGSWGVLLLLVIISNDCASFQVLPTCCKRTRSGDFAGMKKPPRRVPFLFSSESPFFFSSESSSAAYTDSVAPSFDTSNLEDPEFFQGADFVNLQILPHRPLQCTVEESLAAGQHVFVSKIVEGGNADAGNLMVGDVIVGVSGVFGELTDVTGVSIEKIKGLVAGCKDDEPLQLLVARGTTVVQDHEKALVDLCSNPSEIGAEADECILEYLEGGHIIEDTPSYVPKDAVVAVIDDEECDTEDDEADCMLDNMLNMWDEDYAKSPVKVEPKIEEQSAPKVKPWSSRSSPSGTFVRDPVTGKMKNIDA